MPKIKAAADTWSARIGEAPSDPQMQTVVFFCVTNGQRPYHVVEVPRSQVGGEDALESMTEDELRALFNASTSMNFIRTDL